MLIWDLNRTYMGYLTIELLNLITTLTIKSTKRNANKSKCVNNLLIVNC